MADPDPLLERLVARVKTKDATAAAEALVVARSMVSEYTKVADVPGVQVDPVTGEPVLDPVTGLPIAIVVNPIPTDMVDSAIVVCAAEYMAIAKAPNGVLNQQFADGDGMQAIPIRVSGDPLRPVRPLLAAWIGGLTV